MTTSESVTRLSEIPEKTTFDDDQKVYVLQTPTGWAMQKIISKHSIAGFVLAFTTIERAQIWAKKFGLPSGPLTITGIVEVPLMDYVDRGNKPPLALDLNPHLFDLA